ncbi:MAG: hypothetical protein MHM6MM_000798 [Cercozoa sp. M6MM]
MSLQEAVYDTRERAIQSATKKQREHLRRNKNSRWTTERTAKLKELDFRFQVHADWVNEMFGYGFEQIVQRRAEQEMKKVACLLRRRGLVQAVSSFNRRRRGPTQPAPWTSERTKTLPLYQRWRGDIRWLESLLTDEFNEQINSGHARQSVSNDRKRALNEAVEKHKETLLRDKHSQWTREDTQQLDAFMEFEHYDEWEQRVFERDFESIVQKKAGKAAWRRKKYTSLWNPNHPCRWVGQ